MARARGDLFDAVQPYPVMLLDRERIFGRLEDNTLSVARRICGYHPAAATACQ